MIKKNLINKKGFSLIEMMVVVVILGLIVLGLVTFFTGGARSWVEKCPTGHGYNGKRDKGR